MGQSIADMIKRASNTPKEYSNHANHPGHTTAAFNNQKVSIQEENAAHDALMKDVAKTQAEAAKNLAAGKATLETNDPGSTTQTQSQVDPYRNDDIGNLGNDKPKY